MEDFFGKKNRSFQRSLLDSVSIHLHAPDIRKLVSRKVDLF